MAECKVCQELGYVTSGGSRWASAEVCTCRVPCPECEGERQVVKRDAKGLTWAGPCSACGPLERRVALFNGAHIPAACHQKTVEHPAFQPETRSQAEVQRWLMRFQARGGQGDRGVLIMGAPGIGKTHLLCAVLRFLTLERGIRCRYIDSFQLLQQLRTLYESKSGSAALMEELMNVPILGLDELGKTRTTGWQREILDQIVSRRYDQKLTTFITSNYFMPRNKDTGRVDGAVVKDTLEDRVGRRIFSRLMEMCKPFEMDGSDHRQAGAGA